MDHRSALPLLVFLLGCSSDLGPVAQDPCDERRDVDLRVSDDPLPLFTWIPACGMASLQVQPASGSGSGWVLETGDRAPENPLQSGIRYGEPPPGAVESAPATPLRSGVEYTISIYQWLGGVGDEGGLFLRSSASFQR